MIMQPFKFKENRVWRVYLGGKMIDCLRNKQNPVDGLFPEDWIASTVRANNPQHDCEGEGLSTAVIDGADVGFGKLLEQYPEEMLGSRHVSKFGVSTGFLTKLLDSAIRLPIQAHPDLDAAKRLYDSDYGKTETWIILGTREIDGQKPYLILGFNERVNKDVFIKESLDGNMPESLKMVHKHEVKAGDVLLLRGGLIHAIGPGVFMIEIMEPTDLVTQPELYCGEQELTEGDRFGAVSPDKALQVFNFTPETKEKTWQQCAEKPTIAVQNNEYELLILLDRNKIKFFGAEKLMLKQTFVLENQESICRVGIVCQGNMSIVTEDKTLNLKQGDTFFIPACTEQCKFAGQGEIIFALPPV